MKIARFRTADGVDRLGRVDGTTLTDLSAVPGVGSSLREVLPRLDQLRSAIEGETGDEFGIDEVTLLPTVDAPQKFLGIGMNYRAHAEEARQAGIPIPVEQFWFNKQVSSMVGAHDDIVKPLISDELDYEIELGVVIGREAKHISREDARSVIAGYVVVNDVSVRDWLQKKSPTFTLGKSFDTHGPVGPWLTTSDEITDPHRLDLRLSVNGEERQHALSDDMIYDIDDQVAYLTQVMTLMPGDILATGTPPGIGAPTERFLRVGDVVRGEIEGIGAIENRVVAEP